MLKFNNQLIPPRRQSRANKLRQKPDVKKPEKPKVKLLCWSDWTNATTGFGIISRYILDAFYATGRYEITQLAINMQARDYKSPYSFIPAKLQNPEDVYGNQTMAEEMVRGEYDAALIINDTYVTQELSDHLEKIQDMRRQAGKQPIKVIYYYPVDCYVQDGAAGMIRKADCSVAYTHFALVETKKVVENKPDKVIYHGVDNRIYKPLPRDIKQQARYKIFNLLDDECFVWINVNRNTPRKNMALCLMAFKEFQKQVPNSKMYLHTPLIDKSRNHMPLDLRVVLNELELDLSNDVIVPLNYNPAQGIAPQQLNLVYNAADAMITTTFGEGWGLCLRSDTIINTLRGCLPISEVQAGDEVIAEDGKFHKVLAQTSRKTDRLLAVRSMYTQDLYLTENHPVLTLCANQTAPKWIPAKDLKQGDYLAVPKFKEDNPLPDNIDILEFLDGEVEYNEEFVWYKMGYSPKKIGLSISDIQKRYNVSKRVAEDARRHCLGIFNRCNITGDSIAYKLALQIKQDDLFVNSEQLKIKRHIPITEEFLYFIGWYLAEGSNGNNSRIEIDLHVDELPFARRLQGYLDNTFGISSIVEQQDTKKCRVRACGRALALLMGRICGKGAPNKKIPACLLKSPKSLGPLIRSLFLGDGHLKTEDRHYALTTTSASLAYQCRMICAANNILLSVKKYPPPECGNYDQYVCQVLTPCFESWGLFTSQQIQWKQISRKSAVHFKEDKDFYYIKVNSVQGKDVNEQVYDLSIQNTHSFLANGVVVHNSNVEAMAVGLPCVAPNNTALTEIFAGGERGYLYPCKERAFLENSGTRPLGRLEDVVATMMKCYEDWKNNSEEQREMISKGLTFTQMIDWQIIGQQWVETIDEVVTRKVEKVFSVEEI